MEVEKRMVMIDNSYYPTSKFLPSKSGSLTSGTIRPKARTPVGGRERILSLGRELGHVDSAPPSKPGFPLGLDTRT